MRRKQCPCVRSIIIPHKAKMAWDANRANRVEAQARPPTIIQAVDVALLCVVVLEGEAEPVPEETGIGAVTLPLEVFCL